jgi:hypothetical protein
LSRHQLALLVASALTLAPTVARAQRVVVLEVEGDRGNRLREQIESALKKAGAVEVLSFRRYRDAARKKGLRGSKGMTPTAVATVSKVLPFEAAVGGTLADTFFVRILDPSGQELWSRDLPLKGALLSADNARRLAKAIAAAAATVAPAPKTETPAETATSEPTTSGGGTEGGEADAPTLRTPARTGGTAGVGLDVTADARRDDSEAHTETTSTSEGRDTDLEAELHRKPGRIAPKLVTVQLTGTTTWRSYCSRPGPGVTSCAQYDALTTKPPGDKVDFSPQVPYAGVGVTGEGFPLQSFDNAAKGLGLAASYARGFSLTNVSVQSSGSTSGTKSVISIDEAYFVMGMFRYFFSYGDKKDPLIGYVGLRGGLVGRTFDVDPTANVPLPGSHRRFPAIGLDGCVPIAKLIRIEVKGLYFINPAPGIDEIAGYGQTGSGQGWGLEAGVAGDIWGPFGYVLRFNYQNYHDTFTGAGNKWQFGGIAEEAYSGLYWGAFAQF